MVLFRRLLGDVLRDRRMQRGMTLREVSAEARVSLGYISEIERGQKEASSELLASLCTALDLPLSTVLREVSDAVAVEEAAPRPRRSPISRAAVAARSSPPLLDRGSRLVSRRSGWQDGHQYVARSRPGSPSSPTSIGVPHRQGWPSRGGRPTVRPRAGRRWWSVRRALCWLEHSWARRTSRGRSATSPTGVRVRRR